MDSSCLLISAVQAYLSLASELPFCASSFTYNFLFPFFKMWQSIIYFHHILTSFQDRLCLVPFLMSASHTVSVPLKVLIPLHYESLLILPLFQSTFWICNHKVSSCKTTVCLLPLDYRKLTGRKHVCLLATVIRAPHVHALVQSLMVCCWEGFLFTRRHTEYFVVLLGALLSWKRLSLVGQSIMLIFCGYDAYYYLASIVWRGL